jgi:micrococcal nuclease
MSQIAARVLAALALLATLGLTAAQAEQAQPHAGPAYVTRVIDGDTLYAELGGRLEVVRYLGINAPRIEHPAYGTERYMAIAREANRQLVEGRWVRLVFEGPARDSLGRLQAYVWAGSRFVNALLLHHGYAEAALNSTAGYAEYFRMLQEGAQRDGRGVWAEQDARTYHRPRPTELVADVTDGDRSLLRYGGQVFSAPAPFIPSASSVFIPSSTSSSSSTVPAGPSPRSSTGSPSYVAPRGSMQR